MSGLFPSAAEVDARIEVMRANPELRPPSNTYCRGCRLAGLLHCSDVERCGGQVSFDEDQRP
jgi:hypothetical protein